MNKFTRVLAAVVLVGIFTTPAVKAVVWTSEYTGDALPNDPPSDPLWQLTSFGVNGNRSATVNEGILTITTGDTGNQLFYRQSGGAGLVWDPGELGSTLELRMKVNSIGSTWAQKLTIETGTSVYLFAWSLQSLYEMNSTAYVALDTSEYHVYRFTLDSTDSLSIYIDNDQTPMFTGLAGGASGAVGIEFGSLGWGNEAGSADWDYIRWTNAGAFAPVPEPTVLTLFSLAVGALLLRRKRA